MKSVLKVTPFIMIALLFVTGCASVVTPSVNNEAAALRGGAYRLDETHASLLFKIDHLGFSNYVGRFEKFSASLDFDEEDVTAARVSAIIDMASLDIANDEFGETLMGPQWFDAVQFPQAVFESNAISLTGDNTGTMTGDLTLHGITQPVTFDVTFNGGARDILRSAYIVGFSARTTIDRTDFGISKFAGIITNDVVLEIEAEFIRE